MDRAPALSDKPDSTDPRGRDRLHWESSGLDTVTMNPSLINKNGMNFPFYYFSWLHDNYTLTRSWTTTTETLPHLNQIQFLRKWHIAKAMAAQSLNLPRGLNRTNQKWSNAVTCNTGHVLMGTHWWWLNLIFTGHRSHGLVCCRGDFGLLRALHSQKQGAGEAQRKADHNRKANEETSANLIAIPSLSNKREATIDE